MDQDPNFVPGYHLSPIKKGVLGELSKVQEELDELTDAHLQQDRILALVELADLYGALELYMERHMPGMSMEDVRQFAQTTRRAFENGRR